MTCVGGNQRIDNHHIFYTMAEWREGASKELRNHPYCIVPTLRELHKIVHAKVEDGVPIPSDCHIRSTVEALDYLLLFGIISKQDDIERRLVNLILLFEEVEKPTTEALKAQLLAVRRYKYYNPHLF